MNKPLTLTACIGLGAGLMYVLDPDKGRRRRALLRDKVTHTAHKATDMAGKTSRDARNRATGLFAQGKSLFTCEDAPDLVLEARVRSKLGRVVSHPHAVEVKADQGRVTLSGHILSSEVNRLVKRVSSVRGVKSVDNQLEDYEEAGNISDLQGGRRQSGNKLAFLQANWSPATRLIAGAAGSALAVYGAKRQDVPGAVTGTLGLGLLSRALTNMEVAQLIGVSRPSRGFQIQKTINLACGVEQVFDFWTRHEEFPRFMSNVREVKKTGENRYHWTVAGPLGVTVEWEAEIIKEIPNKLLEWKSIEGSAVEQSGIIHFMPTTEGDTCVDIHLSYNPPAGALGHLVAMLFGADPKSEMDEDLMRMKSFIETGHIPHDAAQKKQPAPTDVAKAALSERVR